MQFYKTTQWVKLTILGILVTFTIICFPWIENQYAFSQSAKTNSTENVTSTGVDLIDIHPSPLHLKSGSKFEIISTVVNNSPNTITFTAGVCDSPLSAQFLTNVVIRYTQGCARTLPLRTTTPLLTILIPPPRQKMGILHKYKDLLHGNSIFLYYYSTGISN
jgi:hypothetical protein